MSDTQIDEAARVIAQRCRAIVQACLREEEWADADEEFYEVAREVMAALAREGR